MNQQILSLLLCCALVAMVNAAVSPDCDCGVCPSGTDAETIRRQKVIQIRRATINQRRRTIQLGPGVTCPECSDPCGTPPLSLSRPPKG
ncbi:hypothetical protein BV898_10810 [Hypsibius exemplaris]|uniref:Secreted protein n=1 Tax=Hypsibius exemplaris TaxID=2072580 RepID=A0A1W0WIL1_HYPEX|nr:hypothetical protein BV898_10810 [Hypsibius exemplaris]